MVNNYNINGTVYQNVAKLRVKKEGTNTYADLVDTSDANALNTDIKLGKKAYVNGANVIGTWTPPNIVSDNAPAQVVVGNGNIQRIQNKINFFDEFGKLYYTVDTTDNTAFPLSELPPLPPSITGYTFSWNKTLNEVNAMTEGGCVACKSQVANLTPTILYPHEIGWSGSMSLEFSGYGTALTLTIDWGDGTSTSTVTVSATGTNIYASHTFSSPSTNPITITPSSNVGYYLGGSRDSTGATVTQLYGLFGYNNNNPKQCGQLKKVLVGQGAQIGASCFYSTYIKTNLEEILIPEGCEIIGKYAFQNTYSLATISIPTTVTTLRTHTFYTTQSLSNVVLVGNNLTSIPAYCFYSCPALVSFVIPTTVTKIEAYAFYSDYELENAVISSSSWTQVGDYAFSNCYEAVMCHLDLRSVTSLGQYAFQYVHSLPSVEFSSSLSTISNSAFFSCESLLSAIIPEGITSIGNSGFQGCRELKSITIPSTVTSIGVYAFATCNALHTVNILGNITTLNNQTFTGCANLKSITIPSTVTSIGQQAFSYCYSLKEVTIPASVTSIGAQAFSACFALSAVTLLSATPPTLSSTGIFPAIAYTNTNECNLSCIFYVPSASLQTYKTTTNWSAYSANMVGV